MPRHTKAEKKKKALRAKKGRNVIRGLTQAGVTINPLTASPFTSEQMERARIARFKFK